jgi:septation ring formation regulator EzrA
MQIDQNFISVVRSITSRKEQIKQKQAEIKEDVSALSTNYGISKSEVNKAIKLAEKELNKHGTIQSEENAIEIAKSLAA